MRILLFWGMGAFASTYDQGWQRLLEIHPLLQNQALEKSALEMDSKAKQKWDAPSLNLEWMNQNPFSPMQMKIQAAQNIPLWGVSTAKARPLYWQEKSLRSEYEILSRELKMQWTNLYFESWFLEQKRQLLQNQKALYVQMQKNAWAALSAAKIPLADVQMIQLRQKQWQLDSLQNAKEQELNQKQIQVFLQSSENWIPGDLPQSQIPHVDSTQDFGHLPQVQKIMQEIEVEKAMNDAAKAMQKPMLMLGASYSQNLMGEKSSWGLMLGMYFPLAPWANSGTWEIKARNQKIAQMQNQKLSLQRDIHQKWQSQILNLSKLKAELKLIHEEILPANQNWIQSQITGLSLGQSELSLVFNALEMQWNLQMQQIEKRMQIAHLEKEIQNEFEALP